MNKEILLSNIGKIHTTKKGIDRIKRNFKLDTNNDVYIKNFGNKIKINELEDYL